MSEPPVLQLGQRLRQLRQERQWSLDEAAKQTTVSKAMLGQIERGESSPTLSTLWKIATGFQLSFTALVTDLSVAFTEPNPQVSNRVVSDDRGIDVVTLFPYDPLVGFEVMYLRLEPGSQTQSDPHEQGVLEHLIILEGELELFIDGAWIRLKQGDRVKFAGDQFHVYRNTGKTPVVFHDIIHYAKSSDKS